MIFIIVCIGWNNEKCFDPIDARCKHEESSQFVTARNNYIALTGG